MTISFSIPSEKEMEEVKSCIKEYELDNRSLNKDEFIIARDSKQILGFGRLRRHSDCIELCSLGVVTPHRRKGIGKKIVEELIRKAGGELHLVCIIPDYFLPFGFKVVDVYPPSIANKMNFCSSVLVVPERYCAMKMEIR